MKKKKIVEIKKLCKTYNLENFSSPFYALKDVDLTINKGDNIGIIGGNGAGKTTLLKIIAGIIQPNSGEVKVNGRIVTLMNLEDGFKPELSGRENIYLNGLLVGMTNEQIVNHMDEIIEYSGIGNFVDEPFYKYSTGMKFRLAFSVAIASECDLLILDEMFLVGDFDFQLKLFRSLKKIQNKNQNMATIICSQVPDFVWGFASKFFIADKGEIKEFKREEMAALLRKRYTVWKDVLDLKKVL